MTLTVSFILIAYILIALERWHRTTVVFFFASLAVVIGLITPHEAWEAIDYNTLGLLLGMMIIVNIMKQTGIFRYMALQSVKLSQGNIFKLFFMITAITWLASAFLDNVTTVMLITPISLFIAEMIGISPYPFFIGEIIASNMGGTATLIGDPPNIMIGSAAGLSFFDFITHLAPIAIVVYIIFIIQFKLFEAKKFGLTGRFNVERLSIRPEKALKDVKLLKKTLLVFALVITGFMLHHTIDLLPSVVALMGAALLLLITKHNPEEALKEVEWATLVFLTGFFILVGGLEKYGVIEHIARQLVTITGNVKLLAMVILITSAIISAILDNIPFVAAMIPVVSSINSALGIQTNTLWWALALGSCLGGNGTIVGASANIVVAGISERSNSPLTFKNYLKYGIPTTTVSIILSGIYILLFL